MSEKTRNGGQWTEARYNQFIVGLLRAGQYKWGPRQEAKNMARTRRGFYRCAKCKEEVPATIPAVYKSGKKKGQKYRMDNAIMDHITPVVDPAVGRKSWDELIERLHVEVDGYQCLCHACHQIKCQEERVVATERRKKHV